MSNETRDHAKELGIEKQIWCAMLQELRLSELDIQTQDSLCDELVWIKSVVKIFYEGATRAAKRECSNILRVSQTLHRLLTSAGDYTSIEIATVLQKMSDGRGYAYFLSDELKVRGELKDRLISEFQDRDGLQFIIALLNAFNKAVISERQNLTVIQIEKYLYGNLVWTFTQSSGMRATPTLNRPFSNFCTLIGPTLGSKTREIDDFIRHQWPTIQYYRQALEYVP